MCVGFGFKIDIYDMTVIPSVFKQIFLNLLQQHGFTGAADACEDFNEVFIDQRNDLVEV